LTCVHFEDHFMSRLMLNEILDGVTAEIEKRILPQGGLTVRIGGEYRPDATACVVLAFKA